MPTSAIAQDKSLPLVATTELVESLAREWPVPTSKEEAMAPCAMFNEATGQEQGKEIKE